MDNQETKPDRDILFGIASSQEGYFTTRQAADAGYSTQLLFKHIRAGRVVRTRRGIYRPLTSIPLPPHLRGIEVRVDVVTKVLNDQAVFAPTAL